MKEMTKKIEEVLDSPRSHKYKYSSDLSYQCLRFDYLMCLNYLVVSRYRLSRYIINALFNEFVFKLWYLQESQKVPKLTINLGPKRPMEHAFFAELDKTAKERDQRRNKHKEKHKKKKKKKKHYRSESEESDSESDIDYLD